MEADKSNFLSHPKGEKEQKIARTWKELQQVIQPGMVATFDHKSHTLYMYDQGVLVGEINTGVYNNISMMSMQPDGEAIYFLAWNSQLTNPNSLKILKVKDGQISEIHADFREVYNISVQPNGMVFVFGMSAKGKTQFLLINKEGQVFEIGTVLSNQSQLQMQDDGTVYFYGLDATTNGAKTLIKVEDGHFLPVDTGGITRIMQCYPKSNGVVYVEGFDAKNIKKLVRIQGEKITEIPIERHENITNIHELNNNIAYAKKSKYPEPNTLLKLENGQIIDELDLNITFIQDIEEDTNGTVYVLGTSREMGAGYLPYELIRIKDGQIKSLVSLQEIYYFCVTDTGTVYVYGSENHSSPLKILTIKDDTISETQTNLNMSQYLRLYLQGDGGFVGSEHDKGEMIFFHHDLYKELKGNLFTGRYHCGRFRHTGIFKSRYGKRKCCGGRCWYYPYGRCFKKIGLCHKRRC